MRDLILNIRLIYPPPKPSTILEGRSWLLTGLSFYNEFEVYCFGDTSMSKSPDLGRIFSDIKPSDDNSYTLELGVVLPDLLSSVQEQQEYCLDIVEEERSIRTVCISNQMAKVRFCHNGDDFHVLLPRYKLDAFRADNKYGITKDTPINLLRTTITSRFTIAGSDAEEALENLIGPKIDAFLNVLNKLSNANLMLLKDFSGMITANYDRTTFNLLYFAIQGKQADLIRSGRLALNIPKAHFNPNNLSQEDFQKLVSILNGTEKIDDIFRFLYSAKSYLDGGIHSFALLQIVIAIEIATSRFVNDSLIAAGASKEKLKEYREEIKFGRMLNIDLYALCPEDMKPDRELLGKLNRGRQKRNDFMHEGKFDLNRGDIMELYDAAKKYLQFINDVRIKKGLA